MLCYHLMVKWCNSTYCEQLHCNSHSIFLLKNLMYKTLMYKTDANYTGINVRCVQALSSPFCKLHLGSEAFFRKWASVLQFPHLCGGDNRIFSTLHNIIRMQTKIAMSWELWCVKPYSSLKKESSMMPCHGCNKWASWGQSECWPNHLSQGKLPICLLCLGWN